LKNSAGTLESVYRFVYIIGLGSLSAIFVGNWSAWKKPPTSWKLLTNMLT